MGCDQQQTCEKSWKSIFPAMSTFGPHEEHRNPTFGLLPPKTPNGRVSRQGGAAVL
jgi:hypothetical protein